MHIEKYIHNYKLPDVYCILVIDDKVNDDKVANKNCFEACIKAAVSNKYSKYDVLIDYAADINNGFKKWTKGSYDLVLVDYDFSEKRNKKKEEPQQDNEDFVPPFDFSSIFPEKQGIELRRFILQLRGGSYNYREEFQKIFLWTSHELEKDGREGEQLEFKGKKRKYYLQKEKTGVGKITEILDENKKQLAPRLRESLKYKQFILERLIFLYGKGKYNLQGYVALETESPKDSGTLYPPLVDAVPIFLLPYRPDSDRFHWCELDVLHYLASKVIKKPIGKGLYEKLTNSGVSSRRGGRFIDKHIADLKESNSEIYRNEYFSETLPALKETTEFAGIKFDSDIWLAASPLTMVSRVGNNDEVFGLLINKLDAFFKIGIGAAVLKTTYLESDGIEWPEDHIQRHHRTRVFTPSYNKNQLWNTGKTKLEAFPPKMLNTFLETVKTQKKEWKNKIIISLGVKPDKGKDKEMLIVNAEQRTWEEKWDSVFFKVFGSSNGKKTDNFYPLAEINVRHFLRPLLKHELLGDEYLSPIDENKIENYKKVFLKFETVLKALNVIGIKYQKKLILKFPFRSDIIPFLKCVQKQTNKKKYGIKGVTLINAAKSPYPHQFDKKLTATGDSIKIPQMSGELLAWLRNYILCKLEEINFKLPVSVSGGVAITADDIVFLRQQKLVNSIQLGTLILKDIRKLKKIKNNSADFLKVKSSLKLDPRIIHFLKDNCSKCGKCYNSYYCDAYLNRGVEGGEYPFIDIIACTGCGLCVQHCEGVGEKKALEMVPADKYVILCCPFSESRAFILREKVIPFMFMTSEETSPNKNKSIEIENIKNMAIEEVKKRVKECYKKAKKRTISKEDDEINPLEHSIFLGVKTYILGKENDSDYEITGVPSNKEDVKNTLQKYQKFKAITAYSCWKNNIKIKEEAIESGDFKLTLTKDKLQDEYIQHGIDKAGGIDILGYGSLLFGDLSNRKNDVMIFAGLPSEATKTIKNLRKK
jgi:Pyruvate/2-oxoacid:ferredoxin oxidoreductase delta subunit/predicted house-cleaning NTP pyrophosphatase (Maf/HAM1 superfamily)